MATQREVAEHLDLSVKRVSELIRDGILPSKVGRSPLNIDVCRIAYISYLRKLGGYNKKSGTGDITEEKTKLTAAQARKAELEVEQLEGNLIPAQLVQDTWIDYVANARAKLATFFFLLKNKSLSFVNICKSKATKRETD